MEKIYLDRNENNYGPAPKCLEIVQNATRDLFYQYSTDYKRGMKSILSGRLSEEFNIPEKRILLGYGAEDLLKQVVQSHLGKGEKLLVPDHSWWYYKEIANEVNGINIEYPLVEGKDSYHYDIEKLIDIYKSEKPDIAFISSPNNPTGNSIEPNDLLRVLDELKDCTVVLDEAYWLSSDNKLAANLVNKYPNLIIIRTFSKLYALAGIRIGYALVGENLNLLTKLSNRYLGYNRISQRIAIAALDSAEYYKDVANKMAEDRKLYFDEFNKFSGFKAYKSDANFVLVKMPKESMTPLNDFLKQRGIIIKFMNEELLNSHMRISLGTQEQNRVVIENVKEFLSVGIN
ncbi:MAG: histidinol-phosphate aminotransferase family protein [Ignavibacteriales bacterium]|nr:histidinol-phosphate aminotransferase family protein [Ignavibacteriales bacterium]